MPPARLLQIIESDWVTHIAIYKIGTDILGYVWIGRDNKATHLYYSFYDVKYARQSLGLWLMGDIAQYCREIGDVYLYLGTAYGQKGIYKTNFDCLEFWDGGRWVDDHKLLRRLCREESQ